MQTVDVGEVAAFLQIFAPEVELPLLLGEEIEYLYTGLIYGRAEDGSYYKRKRGE